jgi:SAM-dependent methyltransferase
MSSQALKAANVLLRYAGVQLVRDPSRKPWDKTFARWIAEAKASGLDPNDVGDGDWTGNAFDGASQHLFPRITPQSVVLELGPGTGRYTRHVLPRCHEMILVDYSELVCNWLREYLEGKGRFRVHHIDRPAFPGVPNASVDFAFANGVFEHIDPDDTDFFLQEFHRVLKPGGALWFNFDNFMSPAGLLWFRNETVPAGARRVFRFYHPELLKRMAQMRGFDDVTVTTSEERFAFLDARRPESVTGAGITGINLTPHGQAHSVRAYSKVTSKLAFAMPKYWLLGDRRNS